MKACPSYRTKGAIDTRFVSAISGELSLPCADSPGSSPLRASTYPRGAVATMLGRDTLQTRLISTRVPWSLTTRGKHSQAWADGGLNALLLPPALPRTKSSRPG